MRRRKIREGKERPREKERREKEGKGGRGKIESGMRGVKLEGGREGESRTKMEKERGEGD